MKMIPVASSNLSSVGYDESRRVLRVEFKSGGVVDHVDVPPAVHSALMAAPSHGGHYAREIKNTYAHRKVTGVPAANPPDAAPAAVPHTLDTAVRRYRREE